MATLSILSQPPQELTPAYRPIIYTFLVVGAVTDYPAALSVQPYVDGVAFGNPIRLEPYLMEDSGGNTLHYFRLNLSERVQRFFSNDNFFPALGSGGAIGSDNFQAPLQVVASFYYPNANGILTLQVNEQQSTEFPVLNAYRRGEETDSLELYDLGATTVTPSSVLWLTRKPVNSILCIDDNELLGIFTKGLTAYRIRAFDDSGALQSEGVAFLDISTFGADEVNIIPVGPVNINAISTWYSGSVTIDSDTRYYLIQGGWIFGSSFLSLTPLRRYYIVPSDCRRHRIHFLNSFGIPDSFTIWNNRIREYEVQNQIYQRPILGTGALTDGGTRDVQKKGRISISSPVGNLTNEEQGWLGREFALSAAIMVEEDGAYVPYILQPGTFGVDNDNDANPTLNFTLLQSRGEDSQRN